MLDLAELDVSRAQSLRVQVRACDTLPVSLKGPQSGSSETIVIRLYTK